MPQQDSAPAKTAAARKPKPPNYDPYVRHSTTVNVGRERAFKYFLEEYPSWWPPNFRTVKVGSPLGIEPKEGGRIYELDDEGNEHAFGQILTIEAPKRIVVAWRLNGFGRIDPDNHSEFEVRFVSEGSRRTRVEVEHTKFDQMGTKHAKRVRNGMDKGWPIILATYQEKIKDA
jgi:uncharacterized protein YndB with AHSA1/START domain